MYKICMWLTDHWVYMETHDRLLEACEFADIYKKNNPVRIFGVFNTENGDTMYEV